MIKKYHFKKLLSCLMKLLESTFCQTILATSVYISLIAFAVVKRIDLKISFLLFSFLVLSIFLFLYWHQVVGLFNIEYKKLSIPDVFRIKVKKIITTNKKVIHPEVVEFIMSCLYEIGGMSAQARNLEKKGFEQFVSEISESYDRLDQAENLTLNISSENLKLVCNSAVNTLIEYDDLENIMGITKEEALSYLSLCEIYL